MWKSASAAFFGMFLLFVATTPERASRAGEVPADLHPWDVFEIEMTAERKLGKPVELYTYRGDNHNLSASFSTAMPLYPRRSVRITSEV